MKGTKEKMKTENEIGNRIFPAKLSHGGTQGAKFQK